MEKKSVLFVCTGNIFRSVSAEYALKKFLKESNKDWKVDSAGTVAKPWDMHPKTKETLISLGIHKPHHKPQKVSKEKLKQYDVIIAMAQDHKDFIQNTLKHRNVFLFNELAVNKDSSVKDVDPNWKQREDVDRKIKQTVEYIFSNTPRLYKNICERFYLFQDLVSGEKEHRSGFPFIKLYETKNSVSFMSIDIPPTEDGHILVIPKKRYVDFSQIPKNTMSEIDHSIQKIGKTLMQEHGGYNILLNNGADAGQYIFHTHFHIIPRMYNDGIQIEVWNHKNISKKDFLKLNNKLKQQIRKTK
ncbi:HIT domain-containing protein [Candidatus Woesearchaeota archaeon]|nr:HIT domain-containing protein [Candidatus Woesearchaeota archaeon]